MLLSLLKQRIKNEIKVTKQICLEDINKVKSSYENELTSLQEANV